MVSLAKIALLASAVLVLGPPAAFATPTIRITDLDTGATVTIVDQGPGDMLPLTVGAVLFIGSVGEWVLNVTTGATKPLIGTALSPHMDLSSVNLHNFSPDDLTPGGRLRIEFSETFFGPLPLGSFFLAEIGGTQGLPATIDYKTYLDPDNVLFDQDVLLTDVSSSGSPYALEEISGTNGPLGFYSLTQVVTLSHIGGVDHTDSFNALLERVPQPATAMFLGFGLVLLGALRLRKRI